VQIAPASVPAAVHAVLADALADLPEAPELLHVDVQQLTRTVALVAWPHYPLGSRQA
jgi:hypothetical protein